MENCPSLEESQCRDRHHRIPVWKLLLPLVTKHSALVKKYPYCYDLAEEWIRLTSLPLFSPVWVTTKKLPESLQNDLNSALEYGVGHIKETLEFFKDKCRQKKTANPTWKRISLIHSMKEERRTGFVSENTFRTTLNKLRITNYFLTGYPLVLAISSRRFWNPDFFNRFLFVGLNLGMQFLSSMVDRMIYIWAKVRRLASR